MRAPRFIPTYVAVRWDLPLQCWYWKCSRCMYVSYLYQERWTAKSEAKYHAAWCGP